MDNIDVKIYMENLIREFSKSSTEAESGWDAIKEDFGLEDYDNEVVEKAFREELELIVEDNMLSYNTPKLTVDQFSDLVAKVSTRLALEALVDTGLIQVTFDTESMQNVYSLTEAGKRLGGSLPR